MATDNIARGMAAKALSQGGGKADSVDWSGVLNTPTTIQGYGITDAKISDGTITLGQETLAPVVSVNGKNGEEVTLEASDVGALSIEGGTMSGNLDMSGFSITGINFLQGYAGASFQVHSKINMYQNQISNLATPSDNQDAATKKYVDDATSPEVFIATYGTTTNAEIEEAYQAGKIVFCKQEINEYGAFYIAPLTLRSSETQHMFTCANADFGLSGGSYMRFYCFDNQWNTEQIKIPSITTETTTLAVDGWESDTDGFKQTIAPVEVYTTGYVYTVYPNSTQLKSWGEAGIYADNITVNNEITFHCTDKPTVDILANIKAEAVTS